MLFWAGASVEQTLLALMTKNECRDGTISELGMKKKMKEMK
jgi:hypothetical protein